MAAFPEINANTSPRDLITFMNRNEGWDLGTRDSAGMTVLHKASEAGNWLLLRYILGREDGKRIIDATDSAGRTALLWLTLSCDFSSEATRYWATDWSFFRLRSKSLIKKKVRPLYEAAQLLLTHGANPNIVQRGNTASSQQIHLLSPPLNSEGVWRGYFNRRPFSAGSNALQVAVMKDLYPLVQLLIESGAKINIAHRRALDSYAKDTLAYFQNQVASRKTRIAKVVEEQTPLIPDLANLVAEYCMVTDFDETYKYSPVIFCST